MPTPHPWHTVSLQTLAASIIVVDAVFVINSGTWRTFQHLFSAPGEALEISDKIETLVSPRSGVAELILLGPKRMVHSSIPQPQFSY